MRKSTVPVKLIKQQNEALESREQAKSLISLFRGSEIILDFTGIDRIGLPFADELFRVFSQDHPDIRLQPIDVNADISKTISMVRGQSSIIPFMESDTGAARLSSDH